MPAGVAESCAVRVGDHRARLHVRELHSLGGAGRADQPLHEADDARVLGELATMRSTLADTKREPPLGSHEVQTDVGIGEEYLQTCEKGLSSEEVPCRQSTLDPNALPSYGPAVYAPVILSGLPSPVVRLEKPQRHFSTAGGSQSGQGLRDWSGLSRLPSLRRSCLSALR